MVVQYSATEANSTDGIFVGIICFEKIIYLYFTIAYFFNMDDSIRQRNLNEALVYKGFFHFCMQ